MLGLRTSARLFSSFCLCRTLAFPLHRSPSFTFHLPPASRPRCRAAKERQRPPYSPAKWVNECEGRGRWEVCHAATKCYVDSIRDWRNITKSTKKRRRRTKSSGKTRVLTGYATQRPFYLHFRLTIMH